MGIQVVLMRTGFRGYSQASPRPRNECVDQAVVVTLIEKRIKIVRSRQAQGSVPHAVVLTDDIGISPETTSRHIFPRPSLWLSELVVLGVGCMDYYNAQSS